VFPIVIEIHSMVPDHPIFSLTTKFPETMRVFEEIHGSIAAFKLPAGSLFRARSEYVAAAQDPFR
jgi:hypothetical protein